MSQLTNIPLQDNYKSTLSQAWDGNVWTIYVNTVPSFTFPSWVKTYICVDPWKTNMQVARISAYDATLKTITVDNITLDKGNGVAYTAQTHTVGSVIEISDNYQFREDILTAMNTKVDTNSTDTATGKFANAAARDAYFTSPVNGNSAYLTAEGKRTDYVGGAWVDRATGSTPNASTTVAGKVEIATQAEITAWTSTGWTGALLSTTPDIMATTIQRWEWLYAWASATWNDTYVVTMTPALAAYTTGMIISFKTDVANTWACSININWLWAKNIKTASWQNPLSGEIPATSFIGLQYNGTSYVVMRWNLRPPVDAVRVTRDRWGATWVVTYNHALWRIPTIITTQGMLLVTPWSVWFWYYNNGSHFCVASSNWSVFTTHEIDISYTAWDWQKWVIQNLTATTFDISWTRAWGSSGTNIEVVCVLS